MNILHIISSPRGAASASIQLGNAIVEKLLIAHPGSTLVVNDLTRNPYPFLEEVHLQSFYTPAEARTPELVEAVKHSDAAIAQLKWADIIVIGVPMYNFSIHAGLKSWIDHIARVGQTFSYSAAGVKGLIENKKLYFAAATGGFYDQEPMKSMDFSTPYLRSMLGFLGMTDMTIMKAEGLNIPGVKEHAVEKAIAAIAL